MNKQEALKRIEAQKETLVRLTGWAVYVYIKELIKSLDEPEKVKVPQFVADWIDVCKEHLTTSLYTAMNPNFMKGNSQSFDLILWIKKTSNQDIFARAWLDGYEVEKEKRYKIIILNPDDSHIMLFKLRDTTRMFFRDSNFEGKSGFECELTEKEVREHGFGWVFDCEGVKVEEVE